MDAFAKGLKIAAAIRADGELAKMVKDRYSSWDSGVGAEIEAGKHDFDSLEKYMLAKGDVDAQPQRPAGAVRERRQPVRVLRCVNESRLTVSWCRRSPAIQTQARSVCTTSKMQARRLHHTTMNALLGIDIGTSGTKTLAIDAQGTILASAMETYPCYVPKPLWSEQDPDDWWQATIRSVRESMAKAKLKPADVKAIGLSGQMHGSVFLDKQRQGDPPGDPLERSADRGRVRRDGRARRRPGAT